MEVLGAVGEEPVAVIVQKCYASAACKGGERCVVSAIDDAVVGRGNEYDDCAALQAVVDEFLKVM